MQADPRTAGVTFPLPRKRSVLGVGISATSYAEVVRICESWISDRNTWLRDGTPPDAAPPSRYICVISVHGVIMAREDNTLTQTLNSAAIATPDGMPLVWALRSFGEARQQRVYGPNLMLQLCAMAENSGARVFFIWWAPADLVSAPTESHGAFSRAANLRGLQPSVSPTHSRRGHGRQCPNQKRRG